MTTKNITVAIIAIAVIAVGGYYVLGQQAPNNENAPPTKRGVVSESNLEKATASLRSVIEATGDAQFNFTAQPTYGRYANFGIVQQLDEVRSEDLVKETAILYRGENGDDHAEVDPKTNQVVSFHRASDGNNTANKTEAEIENIVRTFLNQVYPNFAQVEPTLTFNTNMKGTRLNNGNYFFTWDNLEFQKQLPEGASTNRPPFVQVGVTASGYIFSYNNTIDLYRNALQELNRM